MFLDYIKRLLKFNYNRCSLVFVLPCRPFWIKQFWIFHVGNILVVITHQRTSLSFGDFSLHFLLHTFAQSSNVATVNASSERRLKLRQQFHVLVVWLYLVFAQYALNLLLLKWIYHFDRLIILGKIFRCRSI